MSIVRPGGVVNTWQDAYDRGEAEAAAAMTTINIATASLVETVRMMIDTGGWSGAGISSVEHWLTWKAGVSKHRAEGLARIARRTEELPACWGLFREGRLTEDAMVRIARRVPASRDDEVAGLAQLMLIAQLTRVLSCLPELPDAQPKPERERYVRVHTHPDGWGQGQFSLPPDEMAVVMAGLTAARDAEFRDRNDVAADAELPAGAARNITWADAFVRSESEAADALDATFQRTGHRGERNQVVLHQDVNPDGRVGPGRLHLGGFIPDAVARYLACDAQVTVIIKSNGKLLGITPSERTPNRKLRRYLEHRDGGCAHPLCTQRRWLHAHHIWHWEDGGLTVAENLVCLCPRHHRELHHGDFTIEGNPEDGRLTYRDRFGRAIEPPDLGATTLPPPQPTEPTYVPPCGERLNARDFMWN